MLSPDRSEPRTGGVRRARRRTKGRALSISTALPDGAASELPQSFDPNEPWDARSAEALTRLYESSEGDLSRPAPREPARHGHAQTRAVSAEAGCAQEPVDRTWLEVHLSRLAKRLQVSLAQCDPRQSFAELSGRLDSFEQRFSAALGRVAHRSDLDGLKSIEASVMELAAQLDRARDRLDLIGDVDKEVRGLARRLDEAGERRAGVLEKLMRDCMAEWRDGEQRTASALQSLEEAVNRLGDTVDAMEASKPAPELTVPPLAPELERSATAMDSLSRLHAVNGRPHTTHFYHTMLDAADYAPSLAEPRPSAAADLGAYPRDSSLPAAAVEWAAPTADAGPGQLDTSPSTAGGRHVMAIRKKLRRAPVTYGATSPGLSVPGPDGRAADTFKRARLNILLMAGAAVLAGTVYLLSRTVGASLSPANPGMSEAGAHPADGPDLADPADTPLGGDGAS
jgi:hypothetical protein